MHDMTLAALVGDDPPATYTVMMCITAAPRLAITSISTGTSATAEDVALIDYTYNEKNHGQNCMMCTATLTIVMFSCYLKCLYATKQQQHMLVVHSTCAITIGGMQC